MKKVLVLVVLILLSSNVFSQKKEKIKGSRFVTVKQHDLAAYSAIDIGEEFKVCFIKGDAPAIEIEADDNLHDVIDFSINGST
ncbi:MAG: DUF2807 domain-containing protein, partial [Flavobacteriaceae bacterium]|nr:DUF2807 domain-containing protein [Flavobacteriaceae bacterium]